SSISTLTSNPGGALSLTGYYEIDFSNVALTASLNAFLTQVNGMYPNVFDADGGIQDIAFNPTNGMIYGYMSYPSGASVIGRAVTLSAPSGGMSVATPVGTTLNTVPGQEAAGVQFDIAGNMFTLFTTGGYAQVNLTSGALSTLAASNLTLSGGNLRGDIASTVTATPLGMSLLSFNGRNNGVANELSWSTAKEQNNKEFTVERSADQRDWSAIGTVATKAANGNSETKLNYNFSDNAAQAGVVYYRLKQTDRDGKTGYSSVVSIATGNGSNIVMFPNPADESMKISGVQTGNVIRISDITGKVVRSQKVEGNLATLDLSGLSPNMYIVEVSANGAALYTGKVIKK
ncbi:MAG: T9SS type A sorting domain-containing protein, partial [Sphingobacteriales bacterium]